MSDLNRSIRLAAYVATAGTVGVAEADIQLYDGPPIDLSGSVQLELGGLSFEFNTWRDYDQTFNGGSWSFCCGYAGKYYSYCTNWAGSWQTTYVGWVGLNLDCDNDLNGVGFQEIGDVVDGQLPCGNQQTDLCSFSYFTFS